MGNPVVGFGCSVNNLDSFKYFRDDNYCSSFRLNMYSMHLHTKPKGKIYSWTLKGTVSVILSDLLSKDGIAWFKMVPSIKPLFWSKPRETLSFFSPKLFNSYNFLIVVKNKKCASHFYRETINKNKQTK